MVKVAITSTKQGSRTRFGIQVRSVEMARAEPTVTKPLAKAKPVALTKLLLTAKRGHRPSS